MLKGIRFSIALLIVGMLIFSAPATSRDLAEIKAAGTLRHLGIPYANIVTASGDGLDVALIQGFAEHLGVNYEFVPTSWSEVFGDLTGQHARRAGQGAERYGHAEVRGDLIANGMTILDWRQQVVDFSEPTFPSGVWLMARAESALTPIKPSGALLDDIVQTKSKLDGISVLALSNTCLDPGLYRLQEPGPRSGWPRHIANSTR